MNKKGFTLVELLAVIVILGLLAVIVIPVVTNTISDYKVRLCETQIGNIREAARVWGSDNPFSLPTSDGEEIIIHLDELQNAGYIDNDIKDPINSKKNIANIPIKIKKNGKKIDYIIDYNCGK